LPYRDGSARCHASTAVFAWNKSDARIWYGRCSPTGSKVVPNVVVERLPDGSGWDWSVWELGGPKVSSVGIKPTAKAAVPTAEMVAILWDQVREDDEVFRRCRNICPISRR
jgi:hypothetical protein